MCVCQKCKRQYFPDEAKEEGYVCETCKEETIECPPADAPTKPDPEKAPPGRSGDDETEKIARSPRPTPVEKKHDEPDDDDLPQGEVD